MSKNQQEYSCGCAGGIQQDIRQSRAATRDEQLDGFIRHGGEASGEYAPKRWFFQHTQTPAKKHAQGHKFREVCDFS